LLANDSDTRKRNLAIERFSVLPLSHTSGLIGWVENTDTLHQLIRDYREARKIQLNVEYRLMVQMAPDYEKLAIANKIEVFQGAMSDTSGQDLHKVLWLKSQNSEVWLERRRNFTRSLAVMSMAGYILGLGDRHPGNLMLDRISGKIVHIDFGDCFEVAIEREKYPETVPFRLTRMLTQVGPTIVRGLLYMSSAFNGSHSRSINRLISLSIYIYIYIYIYKWILYWPGLI
jgi:FKBP12-rapamycin complex-associated protein